MGKFNQLINASDLCHFLDIIVKIAVSDLRNGSLKFLGEIKYASSRKGITTQ